MKVLGVHPLPKPELSQFTLETMQIGVPGRGNDTVHIIGDPSPWKWWIGLEERSDRSPNEYHFAGQRAQL
jgi:hypothetical protein